MPAKLKLGQTCERKNVWIVREGTSVSKKTEKQANRQEESLLD